jgi:hypothetical protein
MAKRINLREGPRKRGQLGGSYLKAGKYRSNTRCPKCNLLFRDGVWKDGASAKSGEQQWKLCPACLQIRGGQAGGVVEFSGVFTDAHRNELLNRIRNVEKRTREERPLERIIRLKVNREGIIVSATTEHLAARIGKSIQRDFGGHLELRYAPEDKFAVAHWHRD